ncbi:hypothetical protein DERP_014358 [Dermatophagoides pteronyssinus]|uniref:Uncharacterized protein n=1 Tax=Dermatophagoides pteronyssinus TaxID=6956 RepID=A0ABQ8IUZ9_DERPT|nr:hypothetical protein DERP_014358 [Dermatophagoides pteronyssinus]
MYASFQSSYKLLNENVIHTFDVSLMIQNNNDGYLRMKILSIVKHTQSKITKSQNENEKFH